MDSEGEDKPPDDDPSDDVIDNPFAELRKR